MKRLFFLVLLMATFTLCPRRVHAQGVVEYGAATSAAGSLGTKLGSALGSALNNTSKTTTQTVIQEVPANSNHKPGAARKDSPTQPVKSGPASVKMESVPPGAEILVDGRLQGKTPATLSLAKGIHNIEVRHEGYGSWQKTVLLSQGEGLALKPILKDSKTSPPRFTVQR